MQAGEILISPGERSARIFTGIRMSGPRVANAQACPHADRIQPVSRRPGEFRAPARSWLIPHYYRQGPITTQASLIRVLEQTTILVHIQVVWRIWSPHAWSARSYSALEASTWVLLQGAHRNGVGVNTRREDALSIALRTSLVRAVCITERSARIGLE
jgi:hypothetical protein